MAQHNTRIACLAENAGESEHTSIVEWLATAGSQQFARVTIVLRLICSDPRSWGSTCDVGGLDVPSPAGSNQQMAGPRLRRLPWRGVPRAEQSP